MTDQVLLSSEIFELLRIPSTATLTSVLSKHGLRNAGMVDVRPLKPGTHLVGQAFTLRYIPAREDLDYGGSVDNLTDPQRVAIEKLGPHDVLVIDARGDVRAGSMGAILATRLHRRGAAGAVTDGAFRDYTEIAESGLAAFARAAHPAANKTIHHPTDFQVPIACGGVAVYPGDVIVGDDDGVVVIPRHLAAEVTQAAVAQEEREEFIFEKVRNGASIVGVYPPGPETLAEYEEWRKQRAANRR
ncbi:MAG TPA: ribonuclease activity regulator RraA [Chloroflexota bacterium]|nr:ribonuclease activity regulator RraA [Chloroflexota bacterium]